MSLSQLNLRITLSTIIRHTIQECMHRLTQNSVCHSKFTWWWDHAMLRERAKETQTTSQTLSMLNLKVNDNKFRKTSNKYGWPGRFRSFFFNFSVVDSYVIWNLQIYPWLTNKQIMYKICVTTIKLYSSAGGCATVCDQVSYPSLLFLRCDLSLTHNVCL